LISDKYSGGDEVEVGRGERRWVNFCCVPVYRAVKPSRPAVHTRKKNNHKKDRPRHESHCLAMRGPLQCRGSRWQTRLTTQVQTGFSPTLPSAPSPDMVDYRASWRTPGILRAVQSR